MPSVTIDPDGDGNYSQWTIAGGAPTRWEAISDDSDVTYLTEVTNSEKNTSTFAALPAGTTSVVSSTLKCRTRIDRAAGVNEQVDWFARLSGGDGTHTANYTIDWTTPAWIVSAAVPRPGAGNWTPADVNASEFGIMMDSAGGTQLNMYELEVQMDVTYAGGGLIALTLSILGSVLGSNLQLSDMPRLIDTFNRATRKHIIYGHEAVQLFEDIRAERHRKYFLAAA